MPNINYRDPRYQTAVLRAQANPISNKMAAQKEITGQFANQQLGVLSQFQGLADQKERFNRGMKFAQKQADWQKHSFKKNLKVAKAEQKLGLIGGVGTSLVATLIGMDRRKKLQAQAESDRTFQRKILSDNAEHKKKIAGIFGNLGGKY